MSTLSVGRSCHFEQLEIRQLLATDLPIANSSVLDSPDPPLTSVTDSTGSIRGQALLSNGADGEASGLPDIVIRLLGEKGQVIHSEVTDNNGAYVFATLPPGTYTVLEVQPEEYRSASAQPGSGGGIVFEPNLIGEIVVSSAAELTGYNFVDVSLASDPQGEPPLLMHHTITSNRSDFDSLRNVFLELPTTATDVVRTAILQVPPAPPSSTNFVFAVPPVNLLSTNLDTNFGGSSQSTESPEQSDQVLNFSVGQWPIGREANVFFSLPSVGDIMKVSLEIPFGEDEEMVPIEDAASVDLNDWLRDTDDRHPKEQAVDYPLQLDLFAQPADDAEVVAPEQTAAPKLDLPQVARRRAS